MSVGIGNPALGSLVAVHMDALRPLQATAERGACRAIA